MFDASTDIAAPEPQKPLGKDAASLATEEHGRPVPYLAGRARLGLTWISDAWGVHSTPVRRKVGKEKKTVGHAYYASFSGVICLGPVQTLHAIYVEEDKVWEGPLDAASSDYADVTVEGRGPLRIYWGTETQAIDPTLAASGIDHPAYRGQCYAVFDDWVLGENRAQVPQIEFEITRLPVNSGLSVAVGLNNEVNPVAVLEELVLNTRFGVGAPSTLIDYASWNTTAQALADEGFSLTVRLDQSKAADALLTELLEYIGCALYPTSSGSVGLRLLRESATPTTLGAADMTEPPSLTAHGWPEATNSVTVEFRNRNRGWQRDSVTFRDLAGYSVRGRPVTKTISREWVTDPAVAWKIAAAEALSNGVPWMEGRLYVRRGTADNLRPGDTVSVTYSHQGLLGVIFRALSVEVPGPESAHAVVEVREDVSHLLGTGYTPPTDAAPDSTTYEPQPAHDVLVFECPRGWHGFDDPMILVLPARGDTLSNRYTVWRETSPDSYDVAAENDVWGRRGVLNAALSQNGMDFDEGGLDVTLSGFDLDLDAMSYDDGADAGRFLIFVGSEVMYGWDPVLVAPGRYQVSVLRARKGSAKQAHAVGDECWLVQLPVDAALSFVKFSTSKWKVGHTVKFKVQTHILQRELDLSNASPITHTFTRRGSRPLGPENLRVNSDGVAPTYTSGGSCVVDWTLTSEERETADPTVDVESRAESCLLEFWVAGVLKATKRVEETPPHTITNAELISYLGGEVSFTLRAYLARGDYRSEEYDEVYVSKV